MIEKWKDKILDVERAPEPEEIIWKNLGHSGKLKLKWRILTNCLALISMVIASAIMIIINY